VASVTLEALGARPRVSRDVPYAVDGGELDLATIEDGGFDTKVTSLPGNVVFWPRAFVVVANRKVLDELSGEQRTALRQAGRAALEPAIRRLRIEESDTAGILCRRGELRLLEATQSDLASLRGATRPVYSWLERDAKTRALIREIRAIKASDVAAPAVRCRRVSPREERPTMLDGTWEMTAPRRYGIDAGRYRLVLERGRFTFRHVSPPRWGGSGAFFVDHDKLQLRPSDGEDGLYRWNLYRGTLTLRYTKQRIGPPNPTNGPWHRVG
jgi:hypothetical protein